MLTKCFSDSAWSQCSVGRRSQRPERSLHMLSINLFSVYRVPPLHRNSQRSVTWNYCNTFWWTIGWQFNARVVSFVDTNYIPLRNWCPLNGEAPDLYGIVLEGGKPRFKWCFLGSVEWGPRGTHSSVIRIFLTKLYSVHMYIWSKLVTILKSDIQSYIRF